jgi:hypothetical protein
LFIKSAHKFFALITIVSSCKPNSVGKDIVLDIQKSKFKYGIHHLFTLRCEFYPHYLTQKKNLHASNYVLKIYDSLKVNFRDG